MMYALAFNQTGTITEFTMPEKENDVVDYGLLKALLCRIGVDNFEVAGIYNPVFNKDCKVKCVLLVDEEGLFKDEMVLNEMATVLGNQTLVGDALLLAVKDDEELYAFTRDELDSAIYAARKAFKMSYTDLEFRSGFRKEFFEND